MNIAELRQRQRVNDSAPTADRAAYLTRLSSQWRRRREEREEPVAAGDREWVPFTDRVELLAAGCDAASIAEGLKLSRAARAKRREQADEDLRRKYIAELGQLWKQTAGSSAGKGDPPCMKAMPA